MLNGYVYFGKLREIWYTWMWDEAVPHWAFQSWKNYGWKRKFKKVKWRKRTRAINATS